MNLDEQVRVKFKFQWIKMQGYGGLGDWVICTSVALVIVSSKSTFLIFFC
jgi:hypothetical protein